MVLNLEKEIIYRKFLPCYFLGIRLASTNVNVASNEILLDSDDVFSNVVAAFSVVVVVVVSDVVAVFYCCQETTS